jgi:uncharacterized repeat protein (TIGR03803 family)
MTSSIQNQIHISERTRRFACAQFLDRYTNGISLIKTTNLLVLAIGIKFRSFCDRPAPIGILSLLLWGAVARSAFADNPDIVMTNLHSFAHYPDGNYPYGLVRGADGCFYGTTWMGGVYTNGGTIFKISASGACVSLYSFTGGTDGGLPEAGLVEGSDGYFYGTTSEGGTNDSGTVFKISPSGIFTSLYSFTDGTDGSNPVAGLVEGSDGNFYGTTEYGGAYTNGTVFKISASGSFTKLYAFSGGVGGRYPDAGYGTTSMGGTNDNGTVFRISAGSAFTQFYAFPGGGADGFRPIGRLAKGSDGYFYGATFHSGSYFGTGTLFRISGIGAFTSLYSFNGLTDGRNPVAGLVEGGDGHRFSRIPVQPAPGGSNVFNPAHTACRDRRLCKG